MRAKTVICKDYTIYDTVFGRRCRCMALEQLVLNICCKHCSKLQRFALTTWANGWPHLKCHVVLVTRTVIRCSKIVELTDVRQSCSTIYCHVGTIDTLNYRHVVLAVNFPISGFRPPPYNRSQPPGQHQVFRLTCVTRLQFWVRLTFHWDSAPVAFTLIHTNDVRLD